MSGIIESFSADAQRYHVPHPLLSGIAYYTSIIEFIGGVMLIVGFMTTYTLYAMGLDLLLVSFAFSYMEPMWNMKHVFPRFVLVITLLILPKEYQLFSLDHVFQLK